MTRIAPANGEVRSPMPPCGGMRAAAARFAPLIATLCFAVVVCPKVVGGPPDPHMVQSTLAGTQLTADDAEALEERLRGNPHDATARLQLIGYHSFRQWTDSTSAQRHGQLVLWMIRNDPRSPLLAMPYGHIDPLRASEMYERAKESWLEHLEREPDDAVLLGHAAALLGNPTSLFERVADRKARPRSRRSVPTCVWRKNCSSAANAMSSWRTSSFAERSGRRTDWTSGRLWSARGACPTSAATCSIEGGVKVERD